MTTRIIKPTKPNIERAAGIIKDGGVVAFPTETVYGLGADAYNADAVKKIFTAKGRPADNPLIVHCADAGMMSGVVQKIPPDAERLLKRFAPGPLTLVLEKNPKIPDIVTAGLQTVAVRIPASKPALELIRAAGTPIAAPSANASGRPSPTTAQHVYDDLNGRTPLILDGGGCNVGIESTVLDFTCGVPVILRRGGLSAEILSEALGIKIEASKNAGDAPKSPGMKYRHYAPSCTVETFGTGNPGAIIERYDECLQKNMKPAIITLGYRAALFGERNAIKLGNNANDAAHKLFTAFRAAETEYDILLCEELPGGGLGAAVNDRMRRSAVK